MWGRKEETAAQPAQAPRLPADGGAASAGPPAAPPSLRSPAAASGIRSTAQIGKSLRMKGEITGSEDLLIDGEVQGTIVLEDNNLTIGPNGNVQANVKAKSIVVLGHLTGNVRCSERVEIRKTGLLEGDLSTARIVIEDGAVFRGSIDIVKPAEAERPAPVIHRPAAPLAAPPSAGSAAAGSAAAGSSAAKPSSEAARAGQP